jgi:hypothetical protein
MNVRTVGSRGDGPGGGVLSRGSGLRVRDRLGGHVARLAAARLPVDASLPMIDNKVLSAAPLRIVVVMALVLERCARLRLRFFDAQIEDVESMLAEGTAKLAADAAAGTS